MFFFIGKSIYGLITFKNLRPSFLTLIMIATKTENEMCFLNIYIEITIKQKHAHKMKDSDAAA